MHKPRVLYLCNLVSDELIQARGLHRAPSVVAGRLIPTVLSCRRAGLAVWAASLGRNRQQGTMRWSRAHLARAGGIPLVYAAYWDCPVLTHLISLISLAVIVWRLRRRTQATVYWNAAPHFVFALFAARWARIRCILDLEDGLREDVRGSLGGMQRVLLKLWDRNSSAAMVANRGLLDQIQTRPAYVYYGTAPQVAVKREWRGRLQGLSRISGADDLVAALEMLQTSAPEALERMKVIVTGWGEAADRLKAASEERLRGVIEFRGLVTDGEYQRLLESSHFGLSLKIPDQPLGQSTFPSKVIEFARCGLLVVSYRVSDVAEVVSEEGAVLLERAGVAELASALDWIAKFPTEAATRAEGGSKQVCTRLNPSRVAEDLIQLWLGRPVKPLRRAESAIRYPVSAIKE